jgi:predicted lactoylglutathione lyase
MFGPITKGRRWKYCKKKLGGEKGNGTTHLRDHLCICAARNKRSPTHALLKLSEVPGKSKESFVAGTYTFNQDFSKTELAKMIILHEYPIMMVNHVGFRSSIHSLQPLSKIPSRNNMKNDIMKLYENERTKQMNSLGKNKSRIAITTDMWTSSNQNKGYMVDSSLH